MYFCQIFNMREVCVSISVFSCFLVHKNTFKHSCIMCFTCLISSICAFPFYCDFEWIYKYILFPFYQHLCRYQQFVSRPIGNDHNDCHSPQPYPYYRWYAVKCPHVFNMQPFLASSLGLLIFNFYRASIFLATHTHCLQTLY